MTFDSIAQTTEKVQASSSISLTEKICLYIPSKPEDRFKYFPEEYKTKAEAALQDHLRIKDDLAQRAFSFGCSDFESVLSIDVDLQNQSEASKLIALQDEINEFLKKDHKIQEIISAVFIEPSKIHRTVDIAEKILTENDCGIYQR